MKSKHPFAVENTRRARLAQLAKLVHVAVQYQTGRLCGSRTGSITSSNFIEHVTCERCLALLAQEAN